MAVNAWVSYLSRAFASQQEILSSDISAVLAEEQICGLEYQRLVSRALGDGFVNIDQVCKVYTAAQNGYGDLSSLDDTVSYPFQSAPLEGFSRGGNGEGGAAKHPVERYEVESFSGKRELLEAQNQAMAAVLHVILRNIKDFSVDADVSPAQDRTEISQIENKVEPLQAEHTPDS